MGDSVNIGTIYAVGRNYAKHAQELNNPRPEQPIIFTKAACTVVPFANTLAIPAALGLCHYELELAVHLKQALYQASSAAVPAAIDAISLALDLTLREKQRALSAQGLPWDLAKSFVGACPLAPFTPISDPSQLQAYRFTLLVNQQCVQQAQVSEMLFSIAELISFTSQTIPLQAGDVFLTGTPAGVQAAQDGDQLLACLNDEDYAQACVRRV